VANVRAQQAEHDADGGGPAGPVGPQQGDGLAAAELEAGVAQGGHLAVARGVTT
jgi:hypothetical protein